jgi:hypothetical protein
MPFSPEALAKQARWLGTLGHVIPWGLAQKPPWLVADVVIQDEYTHDVILTCQGGDGSVLVLDCT